MAVMDSTGRFRCWAQAMRDLAWPGLTKADVRAAVDATDEWIEANQPTYNLALPLSFRSTASVSQKTFLFCYVAMRRAGRLRAQED